MEIIIFKKKPRYTKYGPFSPFFLKKIAHWILRNCGKITIFLFTKIVDNMQSIIQLFQKLDAHPLKKTYGNPNNFTHTFH